MKIGPTFFNELKAAGIGNDVPIGWFPDEGTLSFTPDVTDDQRAIAQTVLAAHDPTKQLPQLQIDFLAFMALFTTAEQAAIVSSSDIQVKLFVLMASGATQIDLTDPRLIGGVGYLSSLGLIAPARVPAILSGLPPA